MTCVVGLSFYIDICVAIFVQFNLHIMNYQQVAEVVLKVNDKDHKQKFEDAIKRQEELRKKFADATKAGDHAAVDKIAKELNQVNREIANLQTNASNIRAAMQRLDKASPKELRKTIKLINDELNSGRVERGSKEWDEYVEALRKAKEEMQGLNEELDVQESGFKKFMNTLKDWQTLLVGTFIGGDIMSFGKDAVDAFAAMEQEEANVRKFTGLTEEQVASLNEEFKKMDTRTSREGLNQLAQEAGRLGKTAPDDILGFVKAADKINVALDDLGDGATLTLSKLTGIFGDEKRLGTEKSLLAVGSVINELSQNCAASAPYLADFSQRLAGAGAQAGMSVQQIMAFGAVLDSNGQSAEVSATALSQLIMKLYQDPAKFAKTAGLDVKEFTELLKKDANAAIISLLDSLNKMGSLDQIAPALEKMGLTGDGAAKVMATLAGNLDTLRQRQQEANIAFAEATSIDKEFAVQNETVEAQLEKMQKEYKEIVITLGKELLPVIKFCTSAAVMFMKVLTGIVSYFMKHKVAVFALAASYVSLSVAINATTIKTNLHNVAEAITIARTKLARNATLLYASAKNLLSSNTAKATKALKIFSASMGAMGWGILIAAIGGAVAALALLKGSYDRVSEAQKALKKIKDEAAKNAQEEIVNINALVAAARNEKLSLDERQKAINELNRIIPNYNAQLDKTTGKYRENKEALDSYIQSLIHKYEVEGAKAKLQELGKKKAEIKSNINAAEKEKKIIEEDIANTSATPGPRTSGGANMPSASLGAIGKSGQLQGVTSKISKLNDELQRTLDLEKDITEAYGTDIQKSAVNNIQQTVENTVAPDETPTITGTPPTGGLTKSQEKEQRKAEAAAKKAEAAAKKALNEQLKNERAARDKQLAENEEAYRNDEISYAKYMANKDKIQLNYLESAMAVLQKKGLTDTAQYADMLKKHEELQSAAIKRVKDIQLKELKATYNTESAANQMAYNLGEKSYLDYIDKKRTLDQNYLSDRLRIYEEAGLTETEEYAQLLKEKADAETKALENQRKKNLKILENEYHERTDMVTEAMFDTNSPMFGNQRAYNQALLEEDVRYLTEKRDLFAKDSEEWIAANNELNDRINKDQLDKKKQAHEMLLQYSKEYREKDRAGRMKAKLDLLAELHKQGLIKEKEYQEAVAKIKKEYRDNDKDEQKKSSDGIKTEYNDLVNNLYDAFKNLFKSIKTGSDDMWVNIGEAALAAFAVMSTALNSFSAYTDAERDLELAKVEKRYDKEIAAAGKNSKKKEKLEKKKEEETAKIKKKYLKKSQKIEIAQAVASTALAAINSYASAAKENWILGAVAAALATAAGAVQIATIKKQHQAEAEGYYEGGFTGGRDYRKEAGVVHGGEFVANHHAVNNPNILPVLRMIDYAQRNNTVGSLTAEDVSNAIGQGRGVSARGEVTRAAAPATVVTNVIDTSALDRLNQRLDEGIEAHMIMDGEQGAYRKLKHYEQLINNPKR